MANTTLKVRNRIATKTTTEWETENPILLKGEMGYDSTSKRYKIGDGTTAWDKLEYSTISGNKKLTIFKSSTKNNQFNGTEDLTITPSDVIGAMEDGTVNITDNTEFITSNANGFNYSGSVNVPYRRKATYIWNWIKSKINRASDIYIKRTQMIYGTDWAYNLSKNPFDVAYNKFINQSFLKNMPLKAVNFYVSFDNGATWRDYFEVRTDVTKEKLVGYIFNLSNTGNSMELTPSFNNNENKWLRIDINIGPYAYFEISQFMFYGSKNGVLNPTIHLSGHRNENYTGTKPTEEWTEFFSNSWRGWSGWNSYGLSSAIVFGNTSDSLYDKLRIELRGDVFQGESVYKYGPMLLRFMLFGPVLYSPFSNNKSDINLSYTGDMTFPAKITTNGVTIPNGTASQVLLANGEKNTIKTINSQSLLGSGNIDTTQDWVNIQNYETSSLPDNNLYTLPFVDPLFITDGSFSEVNLLGVYCDVDNLNKITYNPILNILHTNIGALDGWGKLIGNISEDPNRWIYLVDILNFFIDDKDNLVNESATNKTWLNTLCNSTTPTKSISTMISEEIAKVVANAPTSFDTLKEIADWISTHQNDASAMNTAINNNTTNITNLTNKVNTNTTDITSLTTKVNNNTTAINVNANDIKDLVTIVNNLNTAVKELQEQNILLQNEINALKSQVPMTVAEEGFYVVDSDGNIGFKVDQYGASDTATASISTTNLDE